MKALVTGIAGFAGNYLCKLLLDKGIAVYGVSQEAEFKPFLTVDRESIRYTSLDLTDYKSVIRLLSDIRPDLIFHLAAISSPATSVKCPRETFDVNLGGTLNLLEGIRLSGLQCRLLMVSSSHVYGSATGPDRVSENAPLCPETPYAASKSAAELLCYQYWKSYQIETVIVRAFNHTGAGQGLGFVCPDLARKMVEIEQGLRPPRLAVSGLDRRIDFSDVQDIVQGYYSALTNGAVGKTYNLCSGEGTAIRTIAEMLSTCCRAPVEIKAGDSEGYRTKPALVGDNTLAQKELGWKPVIPLSETMRGVIEFSRKSYSAASQPVELGGVPTAGRA